MKKKHLIFITVVVVFMLAMSLVACTNDEELKDFTGITFNDVTVTYDGEEHEVTCSGVPSSATVTYSNNKATEVGVYNATAVISMDGYNTLTLNAKLTIVAKAQVADITAEDIVIARAAVASEDNQSYNFKINLATKLSLGGFSGEANGNYEAKYRFKESTKELMFKRVTSGLILYDSTEYIRGTGASKIKISADENGLAKKASILTQKDEGLNLLNIPFVAIIDHVDANNLTNIVKLDKGEFMYKANLALASDNTYVQQALSVIGGMGTSVDIADVSFSNPANGIEFFFNMNDDKSKLIDFKFSIKLSFPIKGVGTTLTLTYEQKASNEEIQIPAVDGLIIDAGDIANELAKITSALSTVKDSATYSLDLEATNQFDPGWNTKAIVDKYYSRLYKNTNDTRIDFNQSFEYKAHTETDGAEKFKYTYGNIEDGSVHKVSRKGTNVVTAAEGITVDTQFDYMAGAAIIDANKVDCIKKTVDKDGVTTYSIYMKTDATLSIKDKITEIINSNEAEGVVDVENYFDTDDYMIHDSVMVVTMSNTDIKSISIDTKIKYCPTGGDYTEERVTLTNSIKLDINANIDKAKEYTAPKNTTTPVVGLVAAKYYIR